MIPQQGFQNERALDCLLHSGGAVGLVVIVSTAWWLLAVPERAADSGGVLSARAAQLRAVHAELLELNRELDGLEARVEERSFRIPAEPRESEFLQDVMRIAAEANFTIRDYQPSQPKTQAGCPHIFIELYGAGDYRSICRFLDEVTRLPRLATVEKLDITGEPADGAYPVAITIAVYFTGRPAAGEPTGGRNHG